MKKILLLFAALLAFTPLHADVFKVHGEVFVPVCDFKNGDGFTFPPTSVVSTGPYFAYPTATKHQALVFPSAVNVSASAEFIVPNDCVPGISSHPHFYALVHLGSTTGTAQLAMTVTQSADWGLNTATVTYAGVTAGAGILPIPSIASSQLQRYEVQSLSSTTTAPMPLYPNRLVNVFLNVPVTPNSTIEVYGLYVTYVKQQGIPR